MPTIELPWANSRAIIDVLSEKAIPCMVEHAGRLEEHVEQYPLGQVTLALHLTDDLLLRSFSQALAAGDSVSSGGVRAQA